MNPEAGEHQQWLSMWLGVPTEGGWFLRYEMSALRESAPGGRK